MIAWLMGFQAIIGIDPLLVAIAMHHKVAGTRVYIKFGANCLCAVELHSDHPFEAFEHANGAVSQDAVVFIQADLAAIVGQKPKGVFVIGQVFRAEKRLQGLKCLLALLGVSAVVYLVSGLELSNQLDSFAHFFAGALHALVGACYR